MFDRVIDGKKKGTNIIGIVKGLLDNSEDYEIVVTMENGELVVRARKKEVKQQQYAEVAR